MKRLEHINHWRKDKITIPGKTTTYKNVQLVLRIEIEVMEWSASKLKILIDHCRSLLSSDWSEIFLESHLEVLFI